jgi:2,3-bisphosphoglycerate-independent phosphoglycerate mutase
MPTRCMLLLLDGLGDRAYAAFQRRTPLQAARTPYLDRLAALGANGSFHASRQGEALPSENAHFAIFGYTPESFPGRGPLEALGAGIDLTLSDVAVLSHFASLQQDGRGLVLKSGKLSVGPDEIRQLAALAADFEHGGVRVCFHHTHKAHGLLTLHGNVAPFFTDTDPVTEGRLLIEPLAHAGYEQDAAVGSAVAALKSYLLHIYRSLKGHPINRMRGGMRREAGLDSIDGLVTQRAGRLKPVQPFEQRYGLKGLSMASGLVYQGLSRFIGMDFAKVNDSEDPGEDMAWRIGQAHRALNEYEFVHVHTKVPDEAAHTKDPEKKKTAIEALDAGLARSLPAVLDDPDILVVVTSDHSTPSSGPLIHSGETVPLIFYGRGVRPDDVDRFDEVSAIRGALGQVRGSELMLMILNALDRAKLHGLMDTPRDQPYWPGSYTAFKIDPNAA